MPFEWKPGANPYRDNAYRVLSVGPKATARQVQHYAKTLARRLRAGETIVIDGREVDERAAAAAASRLRSPESRAEETLLVHTLPEGDAAGGVDESAPPEELRRWAEGVRFAKPPRLAFEEALHWFLPLTADDVEPPPVVALGLLRPGDPDDRAADVVFDV